MTFSIIIPCYNASKYLERTFRCLDLQICKDYEVIIIDDGSTDCTLEKARALCNHRYNAEVYSFPNRGVSIARNEGLRIAKGEYIWFLDADDWFTPNLLNDMLCIINEHKHPDDISFKYQWYMQELDENHLPELPKHEPNVRLLKEEDIVSCMTSNIIGFSTDDITQYYTTRQWNWKDERNTAWSHVYRREFLTSHNILFPEGIRIGEDRIFNCLVMAYAKTVVCTDKRYYYYISSPEGSLRSSKAKAKRTVEDKINLALCREQLRKIYLREKAIDIAPLYTGSSAIACLQLAASLAGLSIVKGYKLYSSFISHPLIRQAIKTIPIQGAPASFYVPFLLLKLRLGWLLWGVVWLLNRLNFNFQKSL